MTKDDLNRQVADDEVRLWSEVKRRSESGPYESVRVTEAGNQTGIHQSRARQLARTWANDGLVQLRDNNGNLVSLTEYGKEFEMED